MNTALFSNQNIIDSVQSYTASLAQPQSTVNVVIDGNVARNIALMDLVLGDMVNTVAHKPFDVLNQCAKAVQGMSVEKFALVRDEVTQQFEAIKAHFQSKASHPYTLSVKECRYENNIFGLANYLADNGFSKSTTVSEAFNVFNKFDLKEWVNTPAIQPTGSNLLILSIMMDILSDYTAKEFAKIIKS